MVFCFEVRYFHIMGYGNDQACLRKRQGAIVAQLFSPLFFCMRSRGGASETKLTLRANRRCKKKAWESDFDGVPLKRDENPIKTLLLRPCLFHALLPTFPYFFPGCDQGTLEWDVSLSIYSKKNYFLLYVAWNTIEWGDSDIFKCDFISVGDSDSNAGFSTSSDRDET